MLTRDDEMSEAALARERERLLGRFRRAVEKRQAGEEVLPKWREREFWNLTSDVVPECWWGMGRSAEYCPLG